MAHMFMMLVIPIAILTLVALSSTGTITRIPVTDPDHLMLAGAFVFMSVLFILAGTGCSWLSRKKGSKNREPTEILLRYSLGPTFMWTPAMFGIISGLIGLAWYVYVPMILAALPGLILTYPTEKRWANWVGESTGPV